MNVLISEENKTGLNDSLASQSVDSTSLKANCYSTINEELERSNKLSAQDDDEEETAIPDQLRWRMSLELVCLGTIVLATWALICLPLLSQLI